MQQGVGGRVQLGARVQPGAGAQRGPGRRQGPGHRGLSGPAVRGADGFALNTSVSKSVRLPMPWGLRGGGGLNPKAVLQPPHRLVPGAQAISLSLSLCAFRSPPCGAELGLPGAGSRRLEGP